MNYRLASKVTNEVWLKSIVLTGGSACLPGLVGRIE